MKSLFIIFTIFLLVMPAQAKYSGGTGAPKDPYHIATAEDLMLLGDSPEDYYKHFILTADINLDPNLPGRKVFDKAVIAPYTSDVNDGFQGTPFTGVFNGNGHTISHLRIKGGYDLGLFGRLGTGAKILNLGLEVIDIDGIGWRVGGLVGYTGGGILTNCYSTGVIRGERKVGGLVGLNYDGTITDCHSTASMMGTYGVGGLVGLSWEGKISGCSSSGNVQGRSESYVLGGLVGGNCPVFGGSTIINCYSCGDVSGETYLGGLVGINAGGWPFGMARIINCYSTGTITGIKCLGGLVGRHRAATASIVNCYATGRVNGATNAGGLVGEKEYSPATITSSLWDIETSGRSNMCGIEVPGGSGCDDANGKTTAEMQAAATFLEVGWDFVDETENGAQDIWWLLEDRSYPRLWWQYGRAFSPHPENGAIDVTQPLLLSWLPGGFGLYHDVYFGEDEEAVTNATTESAEVYRGRQAAEMTTFDPGPLQLGKTYYWRIDEVNEADPRSSWKGDVWRFMTADYLLVDDFESYDDDDENPIWNTWMDGWVNDTGSCLAFLLPPWVGIDPPTHSGMYSMPFGYNNADPPYYSEAYRTWEVPQDWTMGGCSHLSLWVRGEPVSVWEKPDGTVVMSGYGSEREDTRAYGFVHKNLNGDGEIVARIDSLNKAEDWVRAGVMIRANLEHDSPYAATTITGAYGLCFTHCTGGESEGIPTTNTGPQVPHSVKLTRYGNTFTAWHSVDGVTWQDVTDVDGKPVTMIVPMPQMVYIGLCVSGPGWWPWGRGAATAVFSNITITGHVTGTWEVAEQGYWYNPTNSIDNLYIALQDSAGRMGTVIHPDPMAVIVTEWRHWKIPLSAFNSTGVDPMAIRGIYIGVGDRDNPQPNGTGWIHIDDICLTNQMP